MRGWIVLAAVLLLLFLLGQLRLGAVGEYGPGGAGAWFRAGPVRIRLYPRRRSGPSKKEKAPKPGKEHPAGEARGGGAVVDRQSGGLRGSDQRYFPGVRLSQRGIFGVHDGTLHSVQAAGKTVRLKKVTEDIPRRYCLRGISSVMGNYLIDLK